MWTALSAVSIVALAAFVIGVIWVLQTVVGYLQSLLIPVVIAGILAYLFEPVVRKLCVWLRLSRTISVLVVCMTILLGLVLIGLWVIPSIYNQGAELWQNAPKYAKQTQEKLLQEAEKYQQNYSEIPYIKELGNSAQNMVKTLPAKVWNFFTSSLMGGVSILLFTLSLIVVPVYLFFFLRNATSISQHWSDYLPIRRSRFKDEVVACITEINTYLIAYFRGQIIVTIIDGSILGIVLFAIGLPFAVFIGMMVAVLQMIPFLGIVLCWIPAVLIGFAHWNDWFHPLLITIIFIVVSNLDGFIIAPLIVGESVGLHPLTIIISVIAWSLILHGLLGAFLAVPLTATLKVLMTRYVWNRKRDTTDSDKESGISPPGIAASRP